MLPFVVTHTHRHRHTHRDESETGDGERTAERKGTAAGSEHRIQGYFLPMLDFHALEISKKANESHVNHTHCCTKNIYFFPISTVNLILFYYHYNNFFF